MREKYSPYAIFQIGVGLFCILVGVSGFILSARFLSWLEALCLGIGFLLFGLTNNNSDKSEKGKIFSFLAYIFYIIGIILLFYITFFNSK